MRTEGRNKIRKHERKIKVFFISFLTTFLILSAVIAGLLVNKRDAIFTFSEQDRSMTTPLSQPTTTINTTLSSTIAPTAKSKLFIASEKYKPSVLGFKYELRNDQNKAFPIGDNSFPSSQDYSSFQGVTCFRGNNYRNSPSYGVADIKEKKLNIAWSVPIGFIDSWTGVGWTGQPAIVRWSPEVKNVMNINQTKKSKENLTEVIYATMDGKIYFLDLDDGKYTREPINVGYPIKGSVAVDPRGYPILYSGQGIETNNGKVGPIGHRIFSLIDQKQIFFIDGIDEFAYRKWGAFDSCPLINGKTDSLVLPGENGLLYYAKLNTNFDASKKSLSIKPEVYKMRTKTINNSVFGSENSIALYKNYAFYSDNDGVMYCIDINNMTPVWVRSVTDDTDSTTLIEEDDQGVYLYTGCGVEHQGPYGSGIVRKINALTGDTIWEKQYPCALDIEVSGGVMSTGALGKNDLKDYVFYNLAKTKDSANSYGGKLIAFEKSTGKEAWVLPLKAYGWSSPVDIYTRDGKGYIIQCTSDGNIFLIDGKSGKVLNTLSLGYTIEGSPAIFNDTLVIGTRGQKIYGIKIF